MVEFALVLPALVLMLFGILTVRPHAMRPYTAWYPKKEAEQMLRLSYVEEMRC